MFTIDERIRGLPLAKEHVVAVFQSINSPHLAIPGKQAGPAMAFILGVRSGAGFGVFVYLHLPEVQDCAVYASDRRNLTPEQYRDEEQEAISFVESMGFMVDNMNFRQLSADQQDEMMRTLPLFQKDPRMVPAAGEAKPSGGAPSATAPAPSATLSKLFTAF